MADPTRVRDDLRERRDVTAFGRHATQVAGRLPAVDLPLLVVDEEGARDALVEAAQRRARNLPFATLLVVDDDVAIELRAVSPLIVQGAQTADQRRRMFEGLLAGTLTINGRPTRDLLPQSATTRRALGSVMRLADVLLVRSRQEQTRLGQACQQEPQRCQVIDAPDPRVPQVSPAPSRGRIVIWAPDAQAMHLGLLWSALEYVHLPITVICADGDDATCLAPLEARDDARGSSVQSMALPVTRAAEALAEARLVLDASTGDPSSALALARLGVPLLTAVSSGADEWLDGVIPYQPRQYSSVVMALRRGLAGTPPRRAVERSGERVVAPSTAPALPRTPPLVSVVMPTRNRPRMLARALASVERQQWPSVEVMVVNDAGDDVTEIVKRFPQARLITHPEARGVSATRNTGLDAVRGDYVSFLDDDDIYLPDHLRLSVEALEAHAGDFISAAYIAAFVERDVAGTMTVHSLYVYDGVYNGLVMNVWQPVLVQSVVGRAALLRDVRFDTSLPVAEDFEFLIRLGRRGEFGYLLRPTWMITVYDEQGSLSTSNKYAEALRRVYALHPLENAPSLQAQREAQLQRYDTLGGHKEPWLPPLGRLPQRVRLDALDDLRRKV